MYSYSIIQWLSFFYFYCFAGWCFESAYVSVKSRKLTNRGFMRGPFLPIYGSGAIMMLIVSMPFRGEAFRDMPAWCNIALIYVAGCVGATVLEYVTGVAMEALFRVRYWDYSNQRFNFQGHICLGSSLAWGFLTILMTEIVHVFVEGFVLSIPVQALTVVTLMLTAVIFADFALSFKAAIDLRNVLVRMEQAKQELVRIQKRLDVMIALAEEGIENRKEALAESVSTAKDEFVGSITELKSGIEGRLERVKDIAQTKSAAYFEGVREEISELKLKYTFQVEDRKRLSGLKDFFQRDLIRSNPGMTSTRFKEALEELKERAADGKKE